MGQISNSFFLLKIDISSHVNSISIPPKTALDFCCSLAPEVVGTLHKISIQPSGAHWFGHQVRSRHRHLRHGLLRAFEPPRQPREESQVEGGKGGRRTQVEEGPTIPGSSKYVFVFCLLVGFFLAKWAKFYIYLDNAGIKGQKTYRKNDGPRRWDVNIWRQ